MTDERAGADKITDKARDLAERAKEKASELAEKAAPLAEQAKEKASDAAHKAGIVAAQGVGTTAGKLDKATHGKYSGKIKSVSSKLGHLLDRNRPAEK